MFALVGSSQVLIIECDCATSYCGKPVYHFCIPRKDSVKPCWGARTKSSLNKIKPFEF